MLCQQTQHFLKIKISNAFLEGTYFYPFNRRPSPASSFHMKDSFKGICGNKLHVQKRRDSKMQQSCIEMLICRKRDKVGK